MDGTRVLVMGRDEAVASVRESLAAFDSAFAGGDADALDALLDQEVQLMWHLHPTISGREAVTSAFRELFDHVDTSEWKPAHHTVEASNTGAYLISDFTESLMPRDGSAGVHVSGRAVMFFRSVGDRWLITRVLTARSAPDEAVAPD